MPDAHDLFELLIEKSIAADIFSSTDATVGSASDFVINFNYIGGVNPIATAFQVEWFGNTNDRASGTNALSGAAAPSGVHFNPRYPYGGGDEHNGSLSGTAPTLGQSEVSRTIYGKLTIVQAALNI